MKAVSEKSILPGVPSQTMRECAYACVAVSPHGGTMDSLILPQVSEQAMSTISLRMDGAGWHKANVLKAPENMVPIFLPPYSPQLNPVEHIWENVRENGFRNEVFNSIEGAED
jgi:hypothetical protein